MIKNISLIILAILLIVLFFMQTKDNGIEVNLVTIDSLRIDNIKKDIKISKLEKSKEKVTLEKDEYKKLADSIGKYILEHDMDCPEELNYTNKQLLATQKALELCEQAGSIETTKFGICMEVNNNLETIIINKDNIIKFKKKDKRKAFLKNAGISVVGALIIAIVLL